MTLEQTRQLGIEFERRVLVMDPDMEYQEKMDTETIYSFLNQYQDKFVHEIYKLLDNIKDQSKLSSYVETLLLGLLSKKAIAVNSENNMFSVTLPSDFGLYINSSTKVDKTYGMKTTNESSGPSGIIPNVFIAKQQAYEFTTTPQDNMRIIRNPIVFLDNDRTLSVIHDRYTTPNSFILSYYRVPQYMDLMTSTPCELPMDAFEDLVSGALDIYVQYRAGAEARKTQLAKQQELQSKNLKQ